MANIPLVIDEHFKFGETDAQPQYIRNCHPLGRSPALQTDDGYVFESNAILRYLARIATPATGPGSELICLYGRTAFESSQIDSWLDFDSSELNPPVMKLVIQFIMNTTDDMSETRETVERVLGGLDIWLENRTFVVGERLSIADIAIAFTIRFLLRLTAEDVFVEKIMRKLKGVWRLYNTVMHQPVAVAMFAANKATFVMPAAATTVGKNASAAASSTTETKDNNGTDEHSDGDAKPLPPKKVNPLDLLPPSPFSLDAFKREYSNTDTRTVAAPYLFSNLDKKGFSLFYATYKYNTDLTKQFMTANYVRGWFQRMEGHRKYAFGVAVIVGTEEQHRIASMWLLRGTGLPESMHDVEDTVLFDWTEITDVEAEKGKITDFLCWEGESFTEPVLEGRVFK